MKYVSLDIETTGLDEKKCQIIEFGAIQEDSNNVLPFEEMPKFHCFFKYPHYNFEVNAIDMNLEKVKKIQTLKEISFRNDVSVTQDVLRNNTSKFFTLNTDNTVHSTVPDLCFMGNERGFTLFRNLFDIWTLDTYGESTSINLAGKSVGRFDMKFIREHNLLDTSIFHRSNTIEPSVLFVDWVNDKHAPGLEKCFKRAGINKSVSHNALEDAFDVVQLLRTLYVK